MDGENEFSSVHDYEDVCDCVLLPGIIYFFLSPCRDTRVSAYSESGFFLRHKIKTFNPNYYIFQGPTCEKDFPVSLRAGKKLLIVYRLVFFVTVLFREISN